MKDRAAPKAKASKKDTETKKVPGPKLVAKDIKPGIGHNHTGEKNPEAIKCLEELMGFQVQKKAIAKAERDVRNRLKTEFGILASSVAREVALRKLDEDVRVQVETNHEDFKKMLGYQPSLDFGTGLATEASVKAQPSEAQLDARDTEPKRSVNVVPQGKGFVVKTDDDAEGGVINREG